MKRLSTVLLALFMAAGLSFWTILPVCAQEAQEEEEVSAFQLEEVVVTASKRSEDLQSIPRSLAVITGSDLEVRNAVQVADILANTAGVSFTAGGPWLNHIGMRGVMPNTNEIGSEPAVQLNVDGNLSLRTEWGAAPMYGALMDVDRIEILRGPSGAVNGRMAAAGSINVVTKDPDFDDFNGYVGYTVGNYDTKNMKAAINLPLMATGLDLPPAVENLAFRFAIRQDEHSEYIHDAEGNGISGDQDYMTWRGKLRWSPNEDLELLAQMSYSKEESNSGMSVPAIYTAQTWPPGMQAHPQDPWLNETGRGGPPSGKSEQYSQSLKMNWTNDYGTVTARYGKAWEPVDCNNQAGPPGPGGVCYEGDRYQNEYEVYMSSLADSKIEWMFGGYYYYKKEYTGPDQAVDAITAENTTITFSDWYGSSDYYTININDPFFDANNLDRPWALDFIDVGSDNIVFVANSANRPVESYSYYGSIRVPFLDNKHAFALKLRQTIEKKKRAVGMAVFGADEDNLSSGLPQFTFDPDRRNGEGEWVCSNCYIVDTMLAGVWNTDDKPISYSVGYEYNLNDDIMLYANVNNGFKPGGISLNAVPITFYDEETMTNYALGTRSKWFDNRLRLNAEAYLMTFDGYQQNMASAGTIIYDFNGTTYTQAVRGQSRTENFGKTNIYGIELDYDWLITNRDRIKGNLEYRHAKYGDLDLDRGPNNQNPPGGYRYVSFGGRQMPFSPEWSFYASYSHRFNIGNITITPQFDARWVDKSFICSEYWWEVAQPEIWQPAYWKFDGFLNIAPESGNWVVSAYVKNATEEVIRNLALFNVNIEPPRTYGVGLTYNF